MPPPSPSPPPPPLLRRILLLLLLLLLPSAALADPLSDSAALLAIRDAVGRRANLNWNPSDSPCSWQGVACSAGSVTVLRLPGVGLVGALPSAALANLSSLHTLSLRFNLLSGPLPSPLPPSLRNIYLQNNRFSGPLPASLSALNNLVRLNLASNNLAGTIPASLSNLSRLATLYLEDNSFSGQIPPLDLPNLAQFNLSFNNLTGSIPIKLRSQPRSAFLGMKLCGGPLGLCPGEPVPAPSPSPNTSDVVTPGDRKHRKLSGGAIAGIVIGCIAAVLILVLLLVFACRRGSGKTRSVEAKPPHPQPERQPELEIPMRAANGGVTAAAAPPAPPVAAGSGSKTLVFFGGPKVDGKVFDLEDLLRASAEVLGKGTFGTAYKAVMENGAVVAVKRLKDVDLEEGEFRARIEAVGAMLHENLVPLRAYYFSKDEKLLVYDYMSMGSLSALLHGNRGSGRTPLNWESRSSIALAAARGIAYIHSTGPNVSHGNIKSSNILLSKSSDACVSDQGLAHLVNPSSLPTRVAGYRAPEVTDARRVSQKADVYSFGVLLLELLTGKAPQQAFLNDEGVDLPRWVQSVVREEWTSEVFDLELLRYQNVEDEMVQLLQLAMDCAAQYPDNRPTMSEVVKRIEDICRSSIEPVDAIQQQHPTAEDQ